MEEIFIDKVSKILIYIQPNMFGKQANYKIYFAISPHILRYILLNF